MHELSIAQSLFEIVLEEGRRYRLERVNTIRLQIGALAAVVPEALTFSFNMISENSIASGALLEIEPVPVGAHCPKCDVLCEVENLVFLCPECGEPLFDIVSGRELSIIGIEGETGEEDDAGHGPHCT